MLFGAHSAIREERAVKRKTHKNKLQPEYYLMIVVVHVSLLVTMKVLATVRYEVAVMRF